MTQPINTPPMSPKEQAAQERARFGWLRLRQQLSKIAPSDLARFLLVTLAITAILWLSVASWPALAPFLAGGLIAYLLFPIVNILDRVLPRPIAALLTLVGFFTLVFVIIAAIAPALAAQSIRLYTNNLTPEKIQAARQSLGEYLQAQPEPLRSILRNFLENAGVQLQARMDALLAYLASNNLKIILRLVSTVSALIGLLVLPFWILAVLTGQRRLGHALRSLLPDWIEADIWGVIRIIDRTLSAFLRGQLLLGIAVGLVFYLELALMGRLTPMQNRYPILAGLLAGVLQLIPQIGPLIGLLLILIFSLPAGIQQTLVMLGLYVAAQIIVNQLVANRINRRIIDLNPALLILFITALSQFGLLWVLVSAPILSITRDLYRYTYGRFSDPPRPAGLMPGETAPSRPPAGQPAQLPPTTVRGMQPGRRNQSAR